MTKNEERKVLEQIEKLIASTGEDSYLSYAFKGCCKIARENIDNDWACSLQDLYESTEDKLAEAQEMNRRLQKDNELLNGASKRYQEEIFELHKKAKAEHAKQIPGDLYQQLWNMVNEQHTKAEAEMMKIAEVLSYANPAEHVEGYISHLTQERTKRDQAAKTLAYLEKYEPEHI